MELGALRCFDDLAIPSTASRSALFVREEAHESLGESSPDPLVSAVDALGTLVAQHPVRRVLEQLGHRLSQGFAQRAVPVAHLDVQHLCAGAAVAGRTLALDVHNPSFAAICVRRGSGGGWHFRCHHVCSNLVNEKNSFSRCHHTRATMMTTTVIIKPTNT